MIGVQIYDLYSTRESQLLQNLTASEMKSINGGVSNGRSRNQQTSTTDRSELSALLADINKNVANWRLELNETLDNLREQRLEF